MTSRERVVAALNFKQPDRVPVDLNGHHSSGINIRTYKKLREYLNLPPSKLYVYDVIQQLALVEQDVLDRLNVDTFQLGCDFDRVEDYWKDSQLDDGTPCKIPASLDFRRTEKGSFLFNGAGREVAKKPIGCEFYEQSIYPLQDNDTDDFSNLDSILDDIMWCSVPSPPMPINYLTSSGNRKLRNIAAETRDSTDRAIYAVFGGNLVEISCFTFGMEDFFCDLLLNKSRVHKYMDALVDRYLMQLKAFLDAVGDYVDVIGFGDDMGTQNGPQFSVEIYQEFVAPREKILWSYVHDRFPNLKICLHCCGGVRPFLPIMAECGLNAINPVQFTCKGMNLAELKKECYGKIALWGGGCDTREILPHGTFEQIKEHVKQNVNLLNEGGGFVFQQVHNTLSNVKPENFMAMYDMLDELRFGKKDVN